MTRTPKEFNKDVAGHTMRVMLDEGLHRHLRFQDKGSSVNWFDLITWPGALCITGDCGTYVFRRLPDMFEFFRSPADWINEQYWAEKVEAQDRSGIQRWSAKRFEQQVREALKDIRANRTLRTHVLDEMTWVDKSDERSAMEFVRDVKAPTGKHDVFTDTSEWYASCFEYTVRFVWCLRAIVWGINQYDASKPAESAEVAA